MTRVLNIFLSTVSFLLALVMAALWLHSIISSEVVVTSLSGGRHYEMATIPGLIRITTANGWIGEEPLRWYHGRVPADVPVLGQGTMWRTDRIWPLGIITSDRTQRLWFAGDRPRAAMINYHVVSIPLSVPFLVAIIYPTASVLMAQRRKRRERKRVKSGQCPACGYDLRASPERCPECGRDCQAAVGG